MAQELKAFDVGLGQYCEDGSPCVVAFDADQNPRLLNEKVYLKDEVDAVLAEKDAVIAELKANLQNHCTTCPVKEQEEAVLAEKDAEIRRLNRKYWNDKADEAAKMKRLIYDGEIIYLDEYCNEKDWRIMHKVWEDEETKCRAKAEEYK